MPHKARLGLPASIIISLALLAFSAPGPVTSAGAAEAPAETTGSAAVPEELPPAQFLAGGEAASIIGREVRSAADEKLGRIIDVLVDRKGATRAAIIDFGGFLGVGSRKIAVSWDLLIFAKTNEGEERITVQTTRDRLNAAPEFKEGKPVIVLSARSAPINTQVTLGTPSEW